MIRENQGLHIVLIVLVMFTVVFGLTTWVFYRNYDEQATKVKGLTADIAKANNEKTSMEQDMTTLKKWIGMEPGEKVGNLQNTYEKDMKDYGGNYPDEMRVYEKLLEKMHDTIQEKAAELAEAKTELVKLTDAYNNRKAQLEAQNKLAEEAKLKAQQELAGEQTKFRQERERISLDQANLKADKEAKVKDLETKVAQVDAKRQNFEDEGKRKARRIEEMAERIRLLTEGKIDRPRGEIVLSNQRSSTVWVNLGKADGLTPQVSFDVFPATMANMDVRNKKGAIEVTRVVDEHLSEARVVEDQITDPIAPGDKIWTVLWNIGQRKHFALAGFFDLDGDGNSDLALVRHLIEQNGGVVDCYVGDSGAEKDKVMIRIETRKGGVYAPGKVMVGLTSAEGAMTYKLAEDLSDKEKNRFYKDKWFFYLLRDDPTVKDTAAPDKENQLYGVTQNTDYLIVGQAPEKSQTAQQAAYSKIYGDAKQFRIPILQVGDLLRKMGWKNRTPVVRYGHGSNPNDFLAKPEGGVVKKSQGSVSGIFQKREPLGRPSELPKPSQTPSDKPAKTPSSTPGPGTPGSSYFRF